MNEFVWVILIFGIVIVTITVLGHGLWVFLAFVFRGFQPKKMLRHSCAFCNRQTPVDDPICLWCGKEQSSPLAKELHDLEAVQRQLRRFQASGNLKPETAANMLDRVKAYRERLLHPGTKTAPVAKAKPAVTAPPVIKPAVAPPPLMSEIPVVVEVVEEPIREPVRVAAKPPVAEFVAKPQAAKAVAKPQVAVPTPRPVQPPRKSFGELLGSFLQDRNIHWTELMGVLLGGLLMVGFSTAFVVAYWNRLEDFLKFSIFVGYSSVIFAAGLFTYHRWKLRLTGRGLMTIGTLLAPLDFLVMAHSTWSLYAVIAELIALSLFAWLISVSAKALTRSGQWPMVAAVIGNSIMILIVGQFFSNLAMPWLWMLWGITVAGIFAGASMWHLKQLGDAVCADSGKGTTSNSLTQNDSIRVESQNAQPSPPAPFPMGEGRIGAGDKGSLAEAKKSPGDSPVLQSVNSLFMLLGVAGFSAALSLALIAAQAMKVPAMNLSLVMALKLLAAPFCIVAIPALCIGLHLHRWMPRDPKLEAHRAVATLIALLGVALQLIALLLAWPQPLLVATVGVIAAGCLAYMALKYDFPIAHAGAMIGAAIAYLAVFYLFSDPDLRNWQSQTFLIENAKLGSTMLNLTVSAQSGTALGGLFFVFAVISEYFARRGKKEHGAIYVAGSCAVAALGMMLVTWHGLSNEVGKVVSNAVRATVLYGLYGAVGVLLSLRWNRKSLSYIGWNLLAAAPFWLLRLLSPGVWKLDLALAGCLLWVAAVWLWLAWQHRNAILFTLQQIVLSISGLFAMLAWLTYQKWIGQTSFDWLVAYNLQAFGAVLAALSLMWMAVRIALRANERFRMLLNPPWLPVDKIITCGLVVFQAAILVPMMIGGIEHEIYLSGTVQYFQSFCGPTAWILLMLLGAIHVMAMWDRWEKSYLVGSLILVATVPAVIAGYFASDAANASAMRWGCAIVFLLVSATIWYRDQLNKYFTALGANLVPTLQRGNAIPRRSSVAEAPTDTACHTNASDAEATFNTVPTLERGNERNPLLSEEGIDSALLARILCAILTAGPVLAITVFMAFVQLGGTKPQGPSSGLFANLGPNLSYLVPLVLVIAGTVGHALRESSAINAFLAGLVVELAVILGYPLYLTTSKQPFHEAEFMVWVQLMTIAAAVWAICWLVVRRWRNIWTDEPMSGGMPTLAVGMKREEAKHDTPTMRIGMPPISSKKKSLSTILMNVQIGFGVLGNTLLLGIAVLEIILDHTTSFSFAAPEGMPLGWCALGLTVAAAAYRAVQRGRKFSPNGVGLTGMSVLALLACTVPNLPMPQGVTLNGYEAYRVLMIGWATYALLIAIATWWVATQRTLPDAEGPPQAIIRMAAVWVRVAGIAAVLLGLKAGFLHDDFDSERLWAAAGIAIAATAGATMAVWQRREGWAFCAALGANVAASLVVWHVEEAARLPFDQWWLLLVQANVIASSLVALVWLAAHRRLYQLRDWSVRQSPLLALQISLPIVANSAILVLPVGSLLMDPQGLPVWMHKFADPAGWLSLLLPAAAAAWYLERAVPGKLIHVLGGLGLGAGVLVACQTETFVPAAVTPWIAYHSLYVSWTAAAVILLAITFAANTLRLPSWGNTSISSRFPTGAANPWISIICLLAAVLIAFASPNDKTGVWWPLGTVLTLSFTAAAIALWLRSAAHVYFSGLLLNLAGVSAWFAWGEKNAASFLEFQTLALAAAATIWTLLDILGRDWVPHPNVMLDTSPNKERKALPFAHLAIAVAMIFLAVPTFYGVFCDLTSINRHALDKLGWYALAATAGVLVLMLWDRRARYPWLGLYLTGIIATGMRWEHHQFSSNMLIWSAGSDWAGYAIIAALAGWGLSKTRRAGRYLLIPDGENRWAGEWFMPLQTILVGIVTLLCVWLAVDLRFNIVGKGVAIFGFYGRWAGTTGLLMALGAAILMAAQTASIFFTLHKKGATAGLSSSAEPLENSALLGKPAVAPEYAMTPSLLGSSREKWQYAAFVLGMLFMASIRWASLDATDATILAAPWLHRSVSLLLSAAMMCMLASVGLPQLAKRIWAAVFPAPPLEGRLTWSEAGRRILPFFAGLTLCMLALVLVQERFFFDPINGAPVTVSETLIVAGVMAAMFVLVLAFALREDFDPLKLSESGRQAYVYAAEAMLALIGLHIWLTNPHLFQFGIIKRFWMFLVMLVAFAGAGLSEIFHRRKLPVLSLPLERTALLLPMLPALGFFLFDPSDLQWGLVGQTPMLWFFVGIFYGTMAYMRRSLLCGILAVLTANMGLWVALTLGDLSFFRHPQLWLIPLALAALIAEFMNHDRLSKTQSTIFRYLALSVIYISSTADMFIIGIKEHWYLPLVLMVLAVAGALLGMVLRIRSFLLLGIVFLVLDIISVIWYAYHDAHMEWVLYVSGIALGLIILIGFGIFEKRRNDVLAAVEKLKKWER